MSKHWDAVRVAKEVNPKAMDVNLAEYLMQKDPAVFEHLPDSVKTLQMCRQALKHDIENLKHVPDRFRANPDRRETEIKPAADPKNRGLKL